jgi:hypothetical protein
MLKLLLKTASDLSALILRMLLGAVSIQHGAQQRLGWFGRLSVVLGREDSRGKPQAVRSYRRSSQIVRSNFGKSLPDNDGHALAPPFAGIWSLPCFLARFGATIDERQRLGESKNKPGSGS